MYLLDTNIILELLLAQTQAIDVTQLLQAVPSTQLHITDFSLHSLGVILYRHKTLTLLDQVITDLFVNGGVQFIGLSATETKAVIRVVEQLHLDFDDAYQYIAAEKYNLTLVSFDGHFDHTPHGRQMPSQILAKLAANDS